VLRDTEGRFLSARQLKKIEIMRKDGKISLYRGCPVSEQEADVMLLEFKSMH
jgi:hypothetical protein